MSVMGILTTLAIAASAFCLIVAAVALIRHFRDK